ncbi:mechanosensitive ion channel domain-containing protein [Hydrogenimonas sp.]
MKGSRKPGRTVFLGLWLLFATFVMAAQTPTIAQKLQESNSSRIERQVEIATFKSELEAVKKEMEMNVWHKIYANHLTYNTIASKIADIDKQIKRYRARGYRRYRTKISELQSKKSQLQEQLSLLKDYAQNPFKALLKPKEIEKAPSVTNPVAIVGAFSYMKQITEELHRFEEKIHSLEQFVSLLRKKKEILKKMIEMDPSDKKLRKMLLQTEGELLDASKALELHKTALVIYKKKVDEIKLRLTDQIKEQVKRAGTIGVTIFVLLLVVLFFKWLAKRTISDNERFYMANKIINFSFMVIVIAILTLSYIENVSYLVTVLGFASAGIAIAMKDWFMSMLGWLVIVLGGSIHVGDRIRVDRDGKKYVGDVLDISLLRMTILEDITLTTYEHNRRAGRIIFIPNNYIFTDMIANYSHATLKTVWDGIDFTITFNSNHKKATHIARETARKYAKGYTDITRKQLNKLRARYNLKNTNVEPRVFSFIEENGIRVSVWYLTNAYATLTLRSTISAEIIDLIKEEEDIVIAYPSQHIYIDKAKSKPTLPDLSED